MNAQAETALLLPRSTHSARLRASARDFYSENAGLVLVSVSQLFTCLMGVVVKFLNGIDPPVQAIQLVFCRMIITYAFVMLYMLVRKVPHPFLGPPAIRKILLTRGICGFLSLLAYYYSLQYLTVSDAITILFLVPLCTGSMASVVLGEKFRSRDIGAGVVSMFGVLLIARPAFLFHRADALQKDEDPYRLLAVGFGLIGVVGAAGAYTSIRSMGARAHAMHSMAAFSLISTVCSGFTMLLMDIPFVVPTNPKWALLLIAIGFLGFACQTLLTLGLQRQNAGKATIGVYTEIVWALLFDYLIFGTIPTVLSAAGMTIILTSALTVALTKEAPQSRVVETEADATV